MAELKFTIKELHYITEKLIANGEMETGAISPDIVASVLPDTHKDKAADIHAALIQEGLLDAKTEQIACSEHSAIKINYLNADPNLTPEAKAEAEKNVIESLLAGDLSKISANETLIIDGFKLSYEDGKTVLSPMTNGPVMSNFGQIYELFNKDDVTIDVFDLTAPHNGEIIDGELGLVRQDEAITIIEAGPEELTNAIAIFEKSASIPTKDDVFFVAPGIENANEVVDRINNGGNIIPGDCVLTNGVLYSFNGNSEKINCEAIRYDQNAEIKSDRFGYAVTVPSERSAAEDVLGDDDPFVEETSAQPVEQNQENNKGTQTQDAPAQENVDPVTPSTPSGKEKVAKGEKINSYTTKVTNSPYFGYGEMQKFESVDMTPNAQYIARTMNSNEQLRIASEIKINQLYAERAKTKADERRGDHGIFGLFKKLLRTARAAIYLIAKPIVKDWGIFAYNKRMEELKGQINEAKNGYYLIQDNNKKFVNKHDIDVTEHPMTDEQRKEWDEKHKPQEQTNGEPTPVKVVNLDQDAPNVDAPAPDVKKDTKVHEAQHQEQPDKTAPNPVPENKTEKKVEAPTQSEQENRAPVQQQKKVDPRKRLAKDLMAVAPPGTELKMQTEKAEGSDKYQTTVTLMQKEGDKTTEVKLDYDFDRLSNHTNVNISQERLADLQERILVAQQIAKGKADKAGISEESWTKLNKHKHSKAMDAEELISGESSKKTFHVNGIEASVTVDKGLVSISSLGGTDVIPLDVFAQQPREVLNLVVQNMATNKYMGYVCDKIPDMLCDEKASKHFQKVAEGMVDFSTPVVKQTVSGRPIVTIPTYLAQNGSQPLGATIRIDTNSGEISWNSNEANKFNPADIKKMDQILDVVRGKYATEMLEFTSADVIHNDMYVGRVAGEINKAISGLGAQHKEADIVVSGIKVHVSKEDSGTIKVHMSDRDGKHAEEFAHYGTRDSLMTIAEKVQEIGRLSIAQDRADYIKQEALAQREQMQMDGMTTRYGNAMHGPARMTDNNGPDIDEIPDDIGDRE